MSAVEDGLLGGLIVALIPGYRIKLGKPTLNKRQKRPLFWISLLLERHNPWVRHLAYYLAEPGISASFRQPRDC